MARFSEAHDMRGAMLLDADTLERLEPDPARGVRATRMDDADSAVKGIGLRTNLVRSSNSTLKTGKFEDYATLPTYILSENDPEIIAQKKAQREEIRKEVNEAMERESKTLLGLRDTYRNLKQNRNQLFCNQQLFDEILGQIKEKFDTTAALISKIKDAHAKLDSKAS